MGRRAFMLLAWAAIAFISCKKNKDLEQIEITGRLMQSTTDAWANVDLELVEVYNGIGTADGVNTNILGEATTNDRGKFRFVYESNTRTLGGSECNENEDGLLLRFSNSGKTIFSCFPSNKDISIILYTGTMSLLTFRVLDTISAGDTLFSPYAPVDSNDAHYIQLTDSNGFTYPYFFVTGPKSSFSHTYEAYIYTKQYNGLQGSYRGEEAFQWFIRSDSTNYTRLETWRPKGKPYRDTITLSNLYLN